MKNETDEETFTICASSSPKQSNTTIKCKSCSKSCRQLSSEDKYGSRLSQNINSENDQLLSHDYKPNEVVTLPFNEYSCRTQQSDDIAPKIISPNNNPPKAAIRSAVPKTAYKEYKVAQRLCARVKILNTEEK